MNFSCALAAPTKDENELVMLDTERSEVEASGEGGGNLHTTGFFVVPKGNEGVFGTPPE